MRAYAETHSICRANPTEEGGGRITGTRGVEDTMRIWPTESTKQDSQGLTETEATITEPAWF